MNKETAIKIMKECKDSNYSVRYYDVNMGASRLYRLHDNGYFECLNSAAQGWLSNVDMPEGDYEILTSNEMRRDITYTQVLADGLEEQYTECTNCKLIYEWQSTEILEHCPACGSSN